MGGESSADRPRAAKRAFSDTFAAPILLGAMFTAAFYGAIAVLPPDWTFLRRYFCNHALEYASAGLFFVGLGTLLLKWSKLGGERAELRSDLATDLETHDMSGEQLQQALDGITGLRSQTWLVRRLRDASAFVRSRGTSSGLEDHLRYLGELATDQLSRSYALVRTITWAVPILGFLGTVIGITMAIANVTPEQLDSSLGEVTGGLAVAFDTTALALALSIVLVFAQFLVERTEQQLLADVEDFSMRNLPVLYGAGTSGGGTDVLQAASARSLATALDSFVERQMELWNEQLGQLRQRWDAVLDRQSEQLSASLEQGMASTLVSHTQELENARQAFAATVGTSFDQTAARLSDSVESLGSRLDAWQDAVTRSSLAAASQVEALRDQGETMLRLADQGNQLAGLEDQLCRNLEAIRISETFDQTLHNLTAAVHLLSARAASTGSQRAA